MSLPSLINPRARRRFSSFTLVEMLTVIAIIAILMGLSFFAYSSVMKNASRSRARSEITAISSALESYKSDNGGYPQITIFGSTNAYATAFPQTAGGLYQQSSELLYQNLTGQTNFGDAPPTPSTSAMKIYVSFKSTQLGNYSAGGGQVYLRDPFGNSYGYFSGNGQDVPSAGTNFFDVWSTGGDLGATNKPGWIDNWGS